METTNEARHKGRWVRPTLNKARVRDLAKRNDSRAIAEMVIRCVLLVALGVGFGVAVHTGQIAAAAILFLAFAVTMHFLGWAGIGHEVFHGTVFTSRRTNQILFRAFSVLTLSNYGYFASTHIRHHQITMHDGDPEPAPETRWSAMTWFKYLTFDLHGFARRMRILYGNAKGIVPPNIGDSIDDQARRDLSTGARLVLGWVFTAVFLSLAFKTVVPVALFVIAPFATTILTHLLEASQHMHMQRNVWDFRLNSRTIALNRVLCFLYANMNFHIEHHLYPAIPYYNLPDLRAELIQDGFLNSDCPNGIGDAVRIVRGAS